MTVALLAALAGTLGYGAGSVLQAFGATRATGPAVAWHPAYVAGLACDGAAWLASLVALRRLPLFVVQSMLAGSLAVTVLLAAIFLGTRLRARDVAAVAVVVAALATAAGAAGVQSARPAPAGFEAGILLALAGVAALGAASYGRAGSLPMAALAGLAFSGAALGARAVDSSGGWARLLGEPIAWAVLGFGAVGALAYARSLERGAVGPATAVLWGVEVVVPGIVGVGLLGDGVRAGWALPALLAVAAAVAACAVLATAPEPHPPTAHPRGLNSAERRGEGR